MGQTSSRRAHGSARRRNDIEAIPSPVTTAVNSLHDSRSTEGATATSASLTITGPSEAVSPDTPDHVTWPTSDEENVTQDGQKSHPRQIARSLPHKSTVRRRLSRMLPARFHSTPSHVKNSQAPISTEGSSTSVSQNAKDPAVVPQPPSGSSAPTAPNHVSPVLPDSPSERFPSTAAKIPAGDVAEVPDSAVESTPVSQPQAIVSEPPNTSRGELPVSSSSSDPSNETHAPASLVDSAPHYLASDDSERPLDKGKQKAEPEPVSANEVHSGSTPSTSSTPPSSRAPAYLDSLRDERRSAAQRVLSVRPADGPSEDARTQNMPPPEIVERIMDHLRSTGDPEILAALPRSPTEVSNGGNTPYPTRSMNEPHPEPSITSGTAMIVQGVVQTSDLASNRHGARGPMAESSNVSSNAPIPSSMSSAASTSRLHPIRPSHSTSGRRGLFRMSRSNPSAASRANEHLEDESEPPAPAFLPPTAGSPGAVGSGPGDSQSGPLSAIDSAEGIDVLTMLLSVVTAATGTSLMNGSSSPDLSVVSELVNRATSSARPPSTMPPPSSQSSPPSSTPSPITPSPVLPSPVVSTTAPHLGNPSRGRNLLNTVRSRLFRQRVESLPLSRPHSRPRSRAPSMSERTLDDSSDARTVRQEDVIPTTPSPATAPRPREEGDMMAGLRANLTRQLTQALGGDGLGLDRLRNPPYSLADAINGAASRLSGPFLDPSRVPLPPDRPEDFLDVELSGNETAPRPLSQSPTDAPLRPEQIVGLSGDSSMTFEDFLVDIQGDLRATLLRRQDMERVRREQEASNELGRSGPSSPNATSPSFSSSQSDRNSSTTGSPPSSPVRGRHLQHRVPSVDIPLNWWRMFRFPPREGASASTNPLGGFARSPDAVPNLTPSPDLTERASQSGAARADPSPARMLTPVLIVGLRQQRVVTDIDLDSISEFEDAIEEATINSPQSSSTLDAEAVRRRRGSQAISSSVDPDGSDVAVTSPSTIGSSSQRHRSGQDDNLQSQYVDSWRDHLRDYLSSMFSSGQNSDLSSGSGSTHVDGGNNNRSQDRDRLERVPSPETLAHAHQEIRRVREALARERARERAWERIRERARERMRERARESYVIWVIGGFYPEEMVAGLVPHFLLGQFDHDDFWALAELLGQVKPPVASKEDIEKSGLEVIKAAQLPEYTKNGKIAENTVDRCLICLSEYEEEEDVRVLTCRHAFHKDCVDTWMEKGRNNCPACRTKGVETQQDSSETSMPTDGGHAVTP